MQASHDPTGVLLGIVYSLLVAFLYMTCIREDKQRLVESQYISGETLTDMIWFTFHGRSSASVSMKPFRFVLYTCEKIIDYLELPYAFYKEKWRPPKNQLCAVLDVLLLSFHNEKRIHCFRCNLFLFILKED